MIVELGNRNPHYIGDGEQVLLEGPAVTYYNIAPNVREDGSFHPNYVIGTDSNWLLRHIAQNPGPVKQLGGNELLQDVIGAWDRHSSQAPTWVKVTQGDPYPADLAEDFERCLAEYWGIPRERPDDVEATHYTVHGGSTYPPGEQPISDEEAQALEAVVNPPVEGE